MCSPSTWQEFNQTKRTQPIHLGIGEVGITEGVDEVLGHWIHYSLTIKSAKNVIRWTSEGGKEGEGTRVTKILSQCNTTLRSGKRG